MYPEPVERTRDAYRFAVEVKPGERAQVEVAEERTLDQAVALTNLGIGAIQLYIRGTVVSDKVREALGKIVSLRQVLSVTTEELRRLDQQVNEITNDQRRIRENMSQLDRASQIYQRYLKSLTEQEDKLGAIQNRILDLREEESKQRKALDEYLLSLDLP